MRLGAGERPTRVPVGGVSKFAAPSVSPAYIGVGYIIGPELASLNVAGSVLAWGLLVPLLIYFLGPDLQKYLPRAPAPTPRGMRLANSVWRFFVRPIAVGGMMVGAAYTLFRMRKSLGVGLGKAFAELRGVRPPHGLDRPPGTLHELARRCFAGIAVIFVLMAFSTCISLGTARRRNRGGGRDADHRLLLRHGLRIPGRRDRIVEQSDLRA